MPALADLYAAAESASLPVRRHLFAVFHDDNPGPIPPFQNSTLQRGLYGALTCLPLVLTCYLFWRRVKEVRWQTIRHISWIRFLVYSDYIISICFFITSLSIFSVGVDSEIFCRTAIYFCIVFLFLGRLTTQMFLIERAHIANVDYLRRRDDPVWILSTVLAAVFGLFLCVWAFLNPVAYMSASDGKCRKGIPAEVVAPLEAYEIISYVLLTGVFIAMLRRTRQCELFPEVPKRFITFGKMLNPRYRRSHRSSSGAKADPDVNDHVVEVGSAVEHIILPPSIRPCQLRGLGFKSLVGCVLILGWGVINCTIFYVTHGREHVWLCFTQCTMDIFLSVCVLHWLTANPKELERAWRATRPSISELPSILGGGTSISEPPPAKLSPSPSSSLPPSPV